MKIISLQAENFKRLVAVEIRPDGNLVEITGRNRQGKTSVLDAILAALGGKRNIQMVPIRKGCEEALIVLDIGEYKITRKFKLAEDGSAYTTSLKVQTAEGTRVTSEQDVLNALVGDLSFDPLDFGRLAPDKQFDMLKHLVPGVDFEALAAADKEDFEARANFNRRAKELRAQAEGIVLPPGKTPAVVDVAALEKKLGDASEHNTLLERRRNQRAAVQDRCEARTREIEEYRTMIEKLLEAQAADVEMLEKADPLPEPISVADVQAALGNARQSNQVAQRAAEKAALITKAKEAEAQSAELTKAMDAREAAKQKAISEASMPVNGMGFGDGFITLDGVPFEQGSDAERLRASLAIATALNPALRVIRCRDGSLLDKQALKEVSAFADQHDMQIWIELVGDGPSGFVIENGHLKGEEDGDPI